MNNFMPKSSCVVGSCTNNKSKNGDHLFVPLPCPEQILIKGFMVWSITNTVRRETKKCKKNIKRCQVGWLGLSHWYLRHIRYVNIHRRCNAVVSYYSKLVKIIIKNRSNWIVVNGILCVFCPLEGGAALAMAVWSIVKGKVIVWWGGVAESHSVITFLI